MWTAVAAAIAVIGTLGATWLAQRSNTQVRTADRVAEARGRLHEDRMAAYREFTSAYLEYFRKQRPLQAAMVRARRWAADREAATPASNDEGGGSWDKYWAEFVQAGEALVESTRRLADSLALLELVASEPVANAATTVLDAAHQVMQAGIDLTLSTSPAEERLERVADETINMVSSAEKNLVAAIRAELQLDA